MMSFARISRLIDQRVAEEVYSKKQLSRIIKDSAQRWCKNKIKKLESITEDIERDLFYDSRDGCFYEGEPIRIY